MNKYTRLYLNYTKCGPFFNDYMGEFLVSIYNCSHNTYNLKCYLETDRQKWLNDVN